MITTAPPPDQKQKNVNGDGSNIDYGLGGVDLSQRWAELVAGGHVTATTELKLREEGHAVRVRYGVTMLTEDDETGRLSEFAEMLPAADGEKPNGCSELSERVLSINATLAEMQRRAERRQFANGMAIECIYDGPYSMQLQLVRTLRPPRSREMSSDSAEDGIDGSGSNTDKGNNSNGNTKKQCTCQPPPYDPSKDSFLVGSLRLFGQGDFHGEGEPRERAARLAVPRRGVPRRGTPADTTSPIVTLQPWDVYHNISPVDPRGHFLLLPDIADSRDQWRDQSLTPDDCHDLTYLASTIEPQGSMAVSFNSVRAGASQNHVHAHAWPNPPPPLLCRDDSTAEYDSVYAATQAMSLSSFELDRGVVEVSLLEYPCTCIKLSTTTGCDEESGAHVSPTNLEIMGDALSKIIGIAQKMNVPHNVVWMNSHDAAESTREQTIDTYVFFRRSETLDVDGRTFRLGASEMMGVFHASSREQLQSLKKYRGLSCYGPANVLSEVSYEPAGHVWAEVSGILLGKGTDSSRRLQALQRAKLYRIG
mmetsp:Transcript_32091/g.77592  ORF Transcript_32091/g.77592 Transcript_32091/m.77592 type:complete len:535 (-) Transcript_32091:179-1783(-)